jgi:hypothetical protein
MFVTHWNHEFTARREDGAAGSFGLGRCQNPSAERREPDRPDEGFPFSVHGLTRREERGAFLALADDDNAPRVGDAGCRQSNPGAVVTRTC